jgi:hypothetical protein
MANAVDNGNDWVYSSLSPRETIKRATAMKKEGWCYERVQGGPALLDESDFLSLYGRFVRAALRVVAAAVGKFRVRIRVGDGTWRCRRRCQCEQVDLKSTCGGAGEEMFVDCYVT